MFAISNESACDSFQPAWGRSEGVILDALSLYGFVSDTPRVGPFATLSPSPVTLCELVSISDVNAAVVLHSVATWRHWLLDQSCLCTRRWHEVSEVTFCSARHDFCGRSGRRRKQMKAKSKASSKTQNHKRMTHIHSIRNRKSELVSYFNYFTKSFSTFWLFWIYSKLGTFR